MRARCLAGLVVILGLTVIVSVSYAQEATGFPPFSTIAGDQFDKINLANLNVHFDAPIIAKAGRGMGFHYALHFDSSIWFQGVPGPDLLPQWQLADSGFGWRQHTEALTGYVTYETGGCIHSYGNFVYIDPAGTVHTFDPNIAVSNCNGEVRSFSSGKTIDNSGYQLSVILDSSGTPRTTVYPPSGGSITSPASSRGTQANGFVIPHQPLMTGPAQITDTNGNFISTSDGLSFTDTTGANVLTIDGSFSTYTYQAPGGPKSVSIGYTPYFIRTNFGCPGVVEGPAAGLGITEPMSLITSITYPDGSFYQFAYEDTPGFPGAKTGRIAQITLPTGGTISYTYTGGDTGQGVFCDGSPAGLTRTVNDGSKSFQTVYSISFNNDGTSTTHVTNPQGDETLTKFAGIFEVSRQVFQGPASGGVQLLSTQTCYNNDPTCNPANVGVPIIARDTYTYLGALTSRVKTTYDSAGLGLPIEEDDYDWSSTGSFPAPVRKTIRIYNNTLGNIVDRPATVVVKDGSDNVLADTEYRYDEYDMVSTASNSPPVPQHGNPPQLQRGNLTTVSQLVSGTAFLARHFGYYDTGTPSSAQDANGQSTIYNYDPAFSCGYSYVTSVTPPTGASGTGLTAYTSWDCNGGVTTSTSDANGAVNAVTARDTNFWRPTNVQDPLGNVIQTNYASANLAETGMSFNGGLSLTDSITTLDGLGRPHFVQRRQGPGNLFSVFDSVETDYDSLGHARTTPGYIASAIGENYCSSKGQQNCTPPGSTTTYDALGRPTLVKTVDSQGHVISTVQMVYVANDLYVQQQPRAADGSLPTRQYEHDSLGRLTSVCEITTGPGSGTCGQSNPQTGYWTRYFYDGLGNLTAVIQNAQAPAASQQIRNFYHDSLGRMVAQVDPETGTTQFVYDSDAPCGISSPGDLIRKQDNAGNETCYQYDALHRVTAISYAGPNAANTPTKGFIYDAYSGSANAKGRLAVAYTCKAGSCGTAWLTAELFSYSLRGEMADYYQATPNSGGAYHLSADYWAHGVLRNLGGRASLPGMPVIFYGDAAGLDGEGRVTKVSASSGGVNPIVPSVTYNNVDPGTSNQPLGALLSVNFGTTTSGQNDSDSFAYDKDTGRLTSYTFSVGSPAQTDVGQLTWNPNGTLASLQIADALPGAIDRQTCNYTHDDLGRIASVDCGSSVWKQNFSYDPFGNLTKTVPQGSTGVSFPPTPNAYDPATNRINVAGYTYDNNGNLLTDATGSHNYQWDAEGRPVCIDGIVLTYDAMGRNVEQAAGGTCTSPGTNYKQIVYGPVGGKLALMNGQTLNKAFVTLPGGATAVYTASGLAYYRHSDHLGSSRMASTPARTPYYTGAYAPFGESYNESGTTDRSFTGQNQDTVPGLNDFMFRRHSPNQGRWISPDPAGLGAVSPTDPQSWNRYAYVSNRPLTSVDPMGLDPVSVNENGTDCLIYDTSSPTGEPTDLGETNCGINYLYGTGGLDSVSTSDWYLLQMGLLGNGSATGVADAGDSGSGMDQWTSIDPQTLLNISASDEVPLTPFAQSVFSQVGARFDWKGNELTTGLRVPGETFTQCMTANAGEYSLVGGIDDLFGSNLKSSAIANFFGGNAITSLFYGEAGDSGMTAGGTLPMLLKGGVGSALTYGRRGADIMSLNIAGKGGRLGSALEQASEGFYGRLESVDNVLGMGMSPEARWGIDIGFTLAEGVGCLGPR
jgi:RHS repeat-associated protein